MAQKANIARGKKRDAMILKYAEKRAALKAAGDREGLALLPRNSSPVRHKNRCAFTGRSRAYMRAFGMSRIEFRERASRGELPGVTKASR